MSRRAWLPILLYLNYYNRNYRRGTIESLLPQSKRKMLPKEPEKTMNCVSADIGKDISQIKEDMAQLKEDVTQLKNQIMTKKSKSDDED